MNLLKAIEFIIKFKIQFITPNASEIYYLKDIFPLLYN